MNGDAQTSDLGKAERDAAEKSSIIYVRNVPTTQSSSQDRGMLDDPVQEISLGLTTGTRLRARLSPLPARRFKRQCLR